ncbi:MAG TPA: ROK family protein [Blastocatellia bacterium]|jgi:glucokinase|nr:ROK family protein [Blastocatellia bacterium]
MTKDICAIGIDVGGTKIAAGVVTWDGKLLFHRRLPTAAERGGEAVLRDVEALSVELIKRAEEAGAKVAGIGLGVAELVDLHGNVTSGHTIKWNGWPIRERLYKIAPTVIESDVRAAALAEAIYGAGREYEIFLYLTVGTGISCCLVSDKWPYAGAHGDALICASSPLTSTCAECGATNRVTLEEYASGPALAQRYQSYSSEKISRAEEVINAAQGGDARAIEIVRSAGDALGVTTGLLINTLDPEAVVVGGGLGRADGVYWECFLRSTREHIWAEARRDLPMKHAALALNGVIGAAINALKYFGGE